MKVLNIMSRFSAGIILFTILLFTGSYADALTAGETYTINVQKINSDGTVNSAGTSSSGTADSDGKVSFSLTGIPDNSSCNFLLITIKDSAGTTARRSLAPCPNSGESLPVGVSGLTNSQTTALLAALESAGTDDPILAVFGLAIVRSTAASTTELTFMANLANQGINGSGGFVDYLTTNNVTDAQLAAYKSSIITRLADKDNGYSKFIKESVDAATDTEKLNARGEAASKLLRVLVQAATTAGFSQDRVIEAFNAMGAIVVPLMQQAVANGDLSAATQKMIDSSIGGGIQKLKADRGIEEYSQALISLGASGEDVTNYQAAATTLLNAMTAAFETFEQVFNGGETDTAIQAAQTVFNTAMQAAFEQFITDTAASDARINTMISNIESALGGGSTSLEVGNFQQYKSDGTAVNWPVTMVILVDWVSNIVSNGGGMTYTRDTTDIPSTVTWIGSCTDTQYTDQTSCTDGGGTWHTRTVFGTGGAEIPESYASIFGIQEDIMILEFVRWAAEESAGEDMGAHETLQKEFSDSVAALASNIGGTTDGSTAISSALKSAILTLLQSPQF